jgi:CBS domain-containing protein
LGVITKTDLARYDYERANLVVAQKDRIPARAQRTAEDVDRKGFHVEPEEVTIEHWMTPAVFDVRPETIFAAVVKKMVKNGLHHILVTEDEGKKIKGVITTFDVLMVIGRALNPPMKP